MARAALAKEKNKMNTTRAFTVLSGLAATTLIFGATAASAQANATAGQATFVARCAMCHGKEAQGGPMAPSLKGIVGRKAATETAFPRYSAALKASGLTWTSANLNDFLTAPAKKVPGTTMVIALPKADERANVLAYLATLKK
jgi:cytochrome c